MRAYSYQKKGKLQGKLEMEDRIVIQGNTLYEGFHFYEGVESGIYAILDGVGGLHGSAFASTLAARSLADISNTLDNSILRQALENTHHNLVEYSSTATTVTGVMIFDDKATLYHIGNCRLYGLFDGYVRQLTVDQTQREEMLRSGFQEMEIPDNANCVISACLGAKKELIQNLVISDITRQYSSGNRFLLTSDGIHDHVSLDDLEKFLSERITIASLIGLIQLAVENGSEDDMSVMVLEK